MKKIIFTFILCLSLFSTGCDKKPTIKSMITSKISSEEIYNIMSNVGVETFCCHISDLNYALPSENWIRTEFSSALNSFLQSFRSIQWVSEENDCDNFASMAYSFAQILHHNTPDKVEKTGLAFGEFWYITNEGNGHAINVIITKKPDGTNDYKVLFYEPQTQKIVMLSSSEINSALFYRF